MITSVRRLLLVYIEDIVTHSPTSESVDRRTNDVVVMASVLRAAVVVNWRSCVKGVTTLLRQMPIQKKDIFGNEQADSLSKDAQNSPQFSKSLTLTDAIAKRKLMSHPVKKYFILELNCNRFILTTKTSLCTRHFKGMKISHDGQRRYSTCLRCPDIQLSG
ncbi:hypothetical protein TNCV_3170431 [Trichonephila clavipes]|nr:hypothetical protein TNCV_3170431 [Trichonephila clavipes]